MGPGNIYVAAAKKLIAGETGIDFVAGPTEIVIIAAEGDPRWIAADMLAQAEHDVDASAILLTTSRESGGGGREEIERQLETLPTAARGARGHRRQQRDRAASNRWIKPWSFRTRFAPEHLALHDASAAARDSACGRVFLGAMSPEAAGDYASGPNHVLPTSGAARHARRAFLGGFRQGDFGAGAAAARRWRGLRRRSRR